MLYFKKGFPKMWHRYILTYKPLLLTVDTTASWFWLSIPEYLYFRSLKLMIIRSNLIIAFWLLNFFKAQLCFSYNSLQLINSYSQHIETSLLLIILEDMEAIFLILTNFPYGHKESKVVFVCSSSPYSIVIKYLLIKKKKKK